MAHFSIISSQGQHPTLFTGAPRYVGAYLKPGYLEFPAIGSPTAISWHVGDYVVYSRTGKTYRLYRTPQAVEQGEANKYGGSFLYENVQFYDDSKQLELCPFTDLVPGDNTVHFSTQNTVSFFGKPSNVAERLQACLEAQYGSGSWSIKVVTTTDPDLLAILNTEIEFAVSGLNCLEVLDKVYDEWSGLGWIHTVENGVNTITIGASNVRTSANTTAQFSYGNGLVRVERNVANGDKIGTRLFAYGSMKNMDATYYRGLDIYHAESVDIEHLMIPLANWGTTDSKPDARKAYIQNATAIANFGLIPRVAYFDGSGDLPDIHPTIERMTIGEVYDAGGAGYLPDLSKWSRSQRIDEIVAATNPIDHGTSSEQGQKYAETVQGELVADTNTHVEGEAIDTYIGTFTTTKDGKLVLKFGQNAQTIVLSSITGGIDFSDLVLEVLGSGVSKTIPIETPVYSGSNNTFTFHLPESVVIPNTEACEVSLYLNGTIFTRASSGHDYPEKTFTIGIDTATSVDAKVEYEIAKTFVVRIPQIGFDIDDYADLGNGKTISMKTGMCAGRDFEIKDAAYVSSADAWDLTLYRAIDEDLNIMFPNADYEIAAGDQFVLLDIAMPEMYVTVASSRLLAAAQKLLADISVEKPFYNPQIDAKVVYNEGRTLREGMWMDITQEGNREYVLIDSITIDENGSNIPTYEVALRETKGIDWTENIGKSSGSRSSVSVNSNESATGDGTVKSVGLIVPEGMEVEGSPVTNSGVMRIVMAEGYKIPTEAELTQYFEADSGHTNGVKLKSTYASLALPDIYLGTPAESLVADLGIIGKSLGSLQAQIDAVASRDCFDELTATAAFVDMLATDRVYANRYYFTDDIYFYIDVLDGTPCVHLNADFITDGDQIIGGGTPGGGGGGASYLSELLDVQYNMSPSDGDLLIYAASVALNPDGTTTGPGWTKIARSSVGVTTDATQSVHGLMSAADKTKLDGINATYIANGETAYEALDVIGPALQSLQAQIDSVASRDMFDELTASAANIDVLVAADIYGALHGDVAGNAATATDADKLDGEHGSYYATASSVSTLQGYFTNGVANNADQLDGIHAADLFSAIASGAAANISVTIGGTTRTATLYATYDSASENISDKFGIAGSALQSLQGQIDAVASRVDISDFEATTEAKMDYMCDLMRSLQAQVDSVASRSGEEGYIDMLSVGSALYTAYLYSDGDIYANGYFTSRLDQLISSDERVKEDLQPIELTAEQIAACRAVTFTRRDTKERSFGTIAQDWEGILPAAIHEIGDLKEFAYSQAAMVAVINLAREFATLKKQLNTQGYGSS